MSQVFEHYLKTYLIELIIGCLILAIVVVIFSILHVIFQPDIPKIIKDRKIKKIKPQQKIKYNKEFLKRVKGVDLNLNDSIKK
tara:strand:+ start:100 stop:348 length:249 start_codon:yes stop_codon:yes gene_type:complete